MALVECNGVGVLRGSVIRPLVGVWTADLVLDQIDGSGFAPGTKVTITSENGYSLSGVVDPNRTGDFLDSVHVRILGGGGGMSKSITPRGFVQPHAFVRDVVNGILSDAGETLSTTADATFLATNVTAWSLMGKTANWNLRALLNIVAPTMNWRILADGTLWIGNESWPSASGTFDSIKFDPKEQAYLLGIESPFVVPGTNLDGVGHVNLCVDNIESGKLRTTVYVDAPSEGDRDIAETVGRIVRQQTAGVDYHATYLCQVVAQSADLTTVDVSPVGDRNKSLLGGLQRVPVRFGTGIKIKVAQGSTVLLGWDGGNPGSPYVCSGLSGDTAQAIQLAGDDAVATKKDLQVLYNAIANAVVVAQDGGASLQKTIIGLIPNLPHDLITNGWSGATGDGRFCSTVVGAKR